MLGDRGEDVDRKPVGLWDIAGGELDTAFHEVRDEGDIATQAVQLRDDERGAVEAAEIDGLTKRAPMITPISPMPVELSAIAHSQVEASNNSMAMSKVPHLQ